MSVQLAPQLTNGAGHGSSHAPCSHTCPGPHAFPQPPQFTGSLCSSAPYPDAPAPQVTYGAAHVAPHAPAEHVSPPGHWTPQPPQFASSELGSTQRPPHRLSLATQLAAQLPCPSHTSPPGHTSPQPPQLLESRDRFAQPAPHATYGALQPLPPGGTHIPARHTCPPGHGGSQPLSVQ